MKSTLEARLVFQSGFFLRYDSNVVKRGKVLAAFGGNLKRTPGNPRAGNQDTSNDFLATAWSGRTM